MKTLAAAMTCMVLAGVSGAAVVRVHESAVTSLSIDLRAGDLSASAFGAASPNLTSAALQAIHAQLAASSINTDDIITVLAAQTDDGLALFQLIDRDGGDFTSFNSRINFVGHAQDADSSGIGAWLNDAGGELFQQINSNPFASTTDILATFQWDNRGDGDAAAFSRLTEGDNGTSIFVPMDGFGITGISRGFQYLSFEGGSWIVKHTGVFNPGPSSTSFDWYVIPAPGTGALALAGLAVLSRRRR